MIDVAFVRAEDVARGVKTFWFRPERPVRFIAGQFTELYLPHEADDRGIRRWFTISSSPTEELIGITTKFSDDEGSTYKRRMLTMQPGAQLKLADPMGDFVLPKNPTIPLLFVAGGMGITPVRSMIKWLQDTGEQRDITLLHVVSRPEEQTFHDLFTQYNMKFTHHIAQTDGRITVQRILDSMQNDATQIYLSGPETMVETFYKELQANDIGPDRLAGDYFPGYQKP